MSTCPVCGRSESIFCTDPIWNGLSHIAEAAHRWTAREYRRECRRFEANAVRSGQPNRHLALVLPGRLA